MAALCQTPAWQLAQFSSTGDILNSSLSRISFLSSQSTSQGFFDRRDLFQTSNHVHSRGLQLHRFQAEAKDSPFTEKSSIRRTRGGGYLQGARSTDFSRDEKQVREVSQCVDQINSVTSSERGHSDARGSTEVPSGELFCQATVEFRDGLSHWRRLNLLTYRLAQPLRLLIWLQGGVHWEFINNQVYICDWKKLFDEWKMHTSMCCDARVRFLAGFTKCISS